MRTLHSQFQKNVFLSKSEKNVSTKTDAEQKIKSKTDSS